MNKQREETLRFWMRRVAEREKIQHPTYFCVSGDTNPIEAEQEYRKKFGKKPTETFVQFGNLWLGPVDEVTK